jgi:protein tyrosine phosphatase
MLTHEKNKTKPENFVVNVFNIVRKIKEQRLASLENVLQYKFLNAHVVNMLKKIK